MECRGLGRSWRGGVDRSGQEWQRSGVDRSREEWRVVEGGEAERRGAGSCRAMKRG